MAFTKLVNLIVIIAVVIGGGKAQPIDESSEVTTETIPDSSNGLSNDGDLKFISELPDGSSDSNVFHSPDYRPMRLNPCKDNKDYDTSARTGSCYKLYNKDVMWTEAMMICKNDGAHLAILNSPDEVAVIKGLATNQGFDASIMHVGFLYLENQWITLDGNSLHGAGFREWDGGEPNNDGGSEYCGSLVRAEKLNDVPCNSRKKFVCECEN